MRKRSRGGLFMILVLALLLAAGCGTNPSGTPEANYGPITDQSALDNMWRELLDLSVIILNEDFDAPEQLPVEDRIAYCWHSFRRSGGAEGLAPADPEGEDESLRDMLVLPAEAMSALMERYFGFSVSSFTGARPQDYYEGIVYRETEKDFLVYAGEDGLPPVTASGADNPATCYFDSSRLNVNGTTTAVLSFREAPGADPLYTCTVTFASHEDGSLYWKSRRETWPNYGLASLKGLHDRISSPVIAAGLFDGSTVLGGQNEESLFFCRIEWDTLPGSDRKKVVLYQVSQEDFAINRQTTLFIPWSDDYSREDLNIRDMGDHILLLTPSLMLRVSHKLGAPERILLPPFMAERAEGGFAGYDVSADLTKFVYADGEGVHLYQLEIPADELAERIEDLEWAAKAKTEYVGEPVVEGRDSLLLSGQYAAPRFVAGETAVFVQTADGEAAAIPLQKRGAPSGWVSEYSWLEAGKTASFPGQVLALGAAGALVDSGEEAPLAFAAYKDPSQLAGEVDIGKANAYEAGFLERDGTRALVAATRNRWERDAKLAVFVQLPDEEPKSVFTASLQHTRLELLTILEDGTLLCTYYVSPGECGLIRVRMR